MGLVACCAALTGFAQFTLGLTLLMIITSKLRYAGPGTCVYDTADADYSGLCDTLSILTLLSLGASLLISVAQGAFSLLRLPSSARVTEVLLRGGLAAAWTITAVLTTIATVQADHNDYHRSHRHWRHVAVGLSWAMVCLAYMLSCGSVVGLCCIDVPMLLCCCCPQRWLRKTSPAGGIIWDDAAWEDSVVACGEMLCLGNLAHSWLHHRRQRRAGVYQPIPVHGGTAGSTPPLPPYRPGQHAAAPAQPHGASYLPHHQPPTAQPVYHPPVVMDQPSSAAGPSQQARPPSSLITHPHPSSYPSPSPYPAMAPVYAPFAQGHPPPTIGWGVPALPPARFYPEVPSYAPAYTPPAPTTTAAAAPQTSTAGWFNTGGGSSSAAGSGAAAAPPAPAAGPQHKEGYEPPSAPSPQ